MLLAIQTKICNGCNGEFPATIDYFYADKYKKDGLRSYCKACSNSCHKIYISDHTDQNRHTANQCYHNLKIKVINNYGGKCAVCNETNLTFLTIDHINDDGSKYRKEQKHLYQWLKNNNFPSGFQVLCWNHQHLKQMDVYESNWIMTSKAIASRKTHKNVKQQTIIYYGGKCSSCGESNIDLLTIDHICGGGCKHRTKIGYGTAIYYWLRNNNYPKGFRILCFNCNCGK